MTAASGDPGEKPRNEGEPTYPAYEQPVYPAYETPVYPAYEPPPGPAYETPPGAPPYPGPYPPPPGEYPPPPPYGAPYPGYPGYQGYPGHPGYPGYPGYPPQQQGTNGLAITSLVCAILGLIPLCGFLFSLVGIVTGAVALNQVKRTGQQGFGLAVAGIVVGVAVLLIWMVGLTFSWG